jgi:hypothetical protein
MGEFFAAVAVAVAAAVLERLAVHVARSIWGMFSPATA